MPPFVTRRTSRCCASPSWPRISRQSSARRREARALAADDRRQAMTDYVLVEKAQGVAILTMNRPDQLNAMNHQLSAELHDAVRRMTADDEVGCIVITGAGTKAFSAGGDIHEQRENDRRYTQAELDERTAARMRGSYEISASAKPTIGMMNGLAY